MSFLVETSRSKFSESSFCTPNWKCLSHKRVDFGPERKHTVIGFLYQYRSNFGYPGPPQSGDHHLQFYPQKHVVLDVSNHFRCGGDVGLRSLFALTNYKSQLVGGRWYESKSFICVVGTCCKLATLVLRGLLPRNLTWNLKNDGWKTTLLLGWYIFRGYVELPGGNWTFLENQGSSSSKPCKFVKCGCDKLWEIPATPHWWLGISGELHKEFLQWNLATPNVSKKIQWKVAWKKSSLRKLKSLHKQS